VTVTERTREIGIRLALGTRCRDILRQYVAEALALSVAGGAPGIVLGIGVTHVVTTINDWPSRITINSVLFAFLSSAGVGVLFGYYPARRAAQMNPIEALRAE
jgi:putative ABC transport system permease protein